MKKELFSMMAKEALSHVKGAFPCSQGVAKKRHEGLENICLRGLSNKGVVVFIATDSSIAYEGRVEALKPFEADFKVAVNATDLKATLKAFVSLTKKGESNIPLTFIEDDEEKALIVKSETATRVIPLAQVDYPFDVLEGLMRDARGLSMNGHEHAICLSLDVLEAVVASAKAKGDGRVVFYLNEDTMKPSYAVGRYCGEEQNEYIIVPCRL